VADVPYGSHRLGNGHDGGKRPSDADPEPGLSSVDADAEPRRRRFGWRR